MSNEEPKYWVKCRKCKELETCETLKEIHALKERITVYELAISIFSKIVKPTKGGQ